MRKNIDICKWSCFVIAFVIMMRSSLAIAVTYLLPDTGQAACYSDKGRIKAMKCPDPGEPLAQDGSYLLNTLSYTISSGGTVLDNNTFLMWQQDDEARFLTWEEAKNYCESLALNGFSDWRLPTKRELMSIIDFGRYYPSIDITAFPTTKGAFYWSSSVDVCNNGSPWAVNFSFGAYAPGNPSSNLCTRCVRGSPLPFAQLSDNQDGTVTDISTGLMWQQGEEKSMKWGDALAYCEGLSLGGLNDWRLPNAKEFESLTSGTQGISGMTDFFHPNTSFPYWTSTTVSSNIDYKWVLSSLDSLSTFSIRDKLSRNLFVRCVRGGTPVSGDEREIRVTPSDLEFWKIREHEIISSSFLISNSGKDDLIIGMIIKPSSPFSILTDECSGRTLPPLQSCSVTVGFFPNEAGTFADVITIPSDDTDHQYTNIKLKGTSIQAFLMPDTGQQRCFNLDGYQIDCAPAGSPLAQDGSYMHNTPSYTEDFNGTIKDNNTSLMWQQEDDGNLRTWDESKNYCDGLDLGGHTDWRLPGMRELISITDYGTYKPSIDSSIFHNTKPQHYWSGTKSNMQQENAWIINFSDGSLGPKSITESSYVRCVRGPEMTLYAFTDNDDGTVTELLADLIWQKEDAVVSNWESALSHCEGLTFGGHSDWRLPNIKELVSIIDTRYKPAIDPLFFPEVSCGSWPSYWSSTTYLGNLDLPQQLRPDDAFAVNFIQGSAGGNFVHKFYSNYNVRCVRGGIVSSSVTGRVTDSSTGQPLPEVEVTILTSLNTFTTQTDSDGIYSISGLSPGSFTATFEKNGYRKESFHSSVGTAQSLILDVQLKAIPQLTITITSPQDGAIINNSPLMVTGTVSNNATVTVKAIPASVSANSFSALIPLTEGENTIIARATDQYSQESSQIIKITFLPGPAISGISVSGITADSAIVTWITDQPSHSHVEYGTTTGYGNSVTDPTLTNNHSITITNLIHGIPYHFKITSTNDHGISSSSGDNTFTTRAFFAATLSDYRNVTVMEIKGNYDAENPDGTMNIIPRQEIAKEFLKTHSDSYDFLIIFSNFDFLMPEVNARAFYLGIKNDIQGIGNPLFDQSQSYVSNGRLQGIIDMGNISTYVTDITDPKFEETIDTISHEQMHRWGAAIKFKDQNGTISSSLIGKDGNHWSYLFDSFGSVLYGNDWQENGNGTYTSLSAAKYYSPLDLYLMGIYDKSQISPMLLIDNAGIDPSRLPEVGITISGAPSFITIEDIIAAEGERIPNASVSQKSFKTAFILLTKPGSFTGGELPGIENIRNAWAGRFATLTEGKGSIMDVTPSITVAIASPSDGDSITRQDITVKGAIINNTGNETGVTVKGVPATVYGNQFLANIPLAEGSNTITVTATDTAGNTATAAITVNGDPEEKYIQLASNIDSGISPLEVTIRINGSFSFDESTISVEGPAEPEILESSADEYVMRFVVEGIYFITANVTASDGQVYQDTIMITVFNKTQMDNLLKDRWEGMKEKLLNRDVEAAIEYFLEPSKPIYQQALNTIQDNLPNIISEMKDIDMIYLIDNGSKYRVNRTHDIEGVLQEITYYIYFVKDTKGLWKIDNF